MAPDPQRSQSARDQERELRGRRFAALSLAIVCAVFCGVVIGALTAIRVQEGAAAPDQTAYEALRQGLASGLDDPRLADLVRAEDARVRAQYLANRRRVAVGMVLLIAGMVALVLSARWYAALDRALPTPGSPAARTSADVWLARRARKVAGLAGMAAVLVVALVALLPLGRADFPRAPGVPTPRAPEVPTRRAPDGGTVAEAPAHVQAWPLFRGPTGMGLAEGGDWPTSWDAADGTGIVWTAEVPVMGKSSPVLWGDRVFLTGADEGRREVMCFRRSTGDPLWRTPIPSRAASDAGRVEVFEDTGYAAPTPATDGERVYAFFATADLAALDFSGRIVWVRNLGDPDNVYGISTSPIVHDGKLILQFDRGYGEHGGAPSHLLALDPSTGDPVWRTARPVGASWSTPLAIRTDRGPQIVTCATPWVIAYDPASGEELWRADVLAEDVAPSPFFDGTAVYVTGDYAAVAAISPNGRGDVTESHVLWRNESVPLSDTPSPVCDGELLFQVTSYGAMVCLEAATGEAVWERDIERATVWASPVLAGRRVYVTQMNGTTRICELAREYGEQEAGSVHEKVFATPAFADSRIYIRGDKSLFCIGTKP